MLLILWPKAVIKPEVLAEKKIGRKNCFKQIDRFSQKYFHFKLKEDLWGDNYWHRYLESDFFISFTQLSE